MEEDEKEGKKRRYMYVSYLTCLWDGADYQ
jgi:hypothetical protein